MVKIWSMKNVKCVASEWDACYIAYSKQCKGYTVDVVYCGDHWEVRWSA